MSNRLITNLYPMDCRRISICAYYLIIEQSEVAPQSCLRLKSYTIINAMGKKVQI